MTLDVPSSIARRFAPRARTAALALAAAALALAGCGPADDGSCTIAYSGNYTASVHEPAGTVSLVADAASGGVLFGLDASARADEVMLSVQIDLGASPGPGTFSSDAVAHWRATGASRTTSCVYSAGDQSVPAGSFTLTLTSLTAPGGSSSGVAHGTLHLEQFVQAPAGTDCGPGDTESVDVEF